MCVCDDLAKRKDGFILIRKSLIATVIRSTAIKTKYVMDLQLKINENTVLHYIEDSQNHYDNDGNNIIDCYQLSFSFYDCHYYVGVSRKDIEQDESFLIALDGDSKLFDSFEEMWQNEIWGLIKEKCNEYDKWNAEFMQ